MNDISLRPIAPSDNQALALIIRNTLEEYGANHPGTVYFDESTDHLSDLFAVEGAAYFVVVTGEEIVGGAGIYPTKGLPASTCELVKMYLTRKARGWGIGKLLMQQALSSASNLGYEQVYLETMPELTDAIPLYLKYGFHHLPGPLGCTGHHGCKLWMLKKL